MNSPTPLGVAERVGKNWRKPCVRVRGGFYGTWDSGLPLARQKKRRENSSREKDSFSEQTEMENEPEKLERDCKDLGGRREVREGRL
ncbi:hypothetical protein K0M31_017655 [Melipona bicolor]|uniref:Uncharacterized protein n=1 Tax=Melipona bicolor TaxID=60889 RepID=A0AA40KSP0_9HYME|nr:hypothetical protein K0M31_017655 [Melipona bicolor]